MTETEFEHRSGCDVGQDSGHCHIRKVFGVMFFGHRDRTCRQELKAVFGHSLLRAQTSAGGDVGSLAQHMLPKCLAGVRAEVDMAVAELRVLLLIVFPVMWKLLGPDYM